MHGGRRGGAAAKNKFEVHAQNKSWGGADEKFSMELYILFEILASRRCYDFNLKVFPQKHININLCAAAMYCR